MTGKRIDITAWINANAKGFHESMKRVRADGQKTGKAFEAEIAGTSARLRGMATSPLAITAALTAAATAAITTARAVADIGREARRSGLGVEAFQELSFVAEQARIPVDAMVDGLKELNLRADEFIVTGSGSAAEAFERLGFSAAELAERLKDPNALFIEIIGRMEDLDRAAQIRIADELFGGTAGERFVELIDAGAAGIEEQIALARELGIVMDDELVAKAEELDRQFAIIAQTITRGVQGAIVEVTAAIMPFINRMREFDEMVTRWRTMFHVNWASNLDDLPWGETLPELPEHVATAWRGAVDANQKGARLFQDQLGQAGIQMRIDAAFDAPAANATDSGASRDRATEAAERERQAVRDLIKALEFEMSIVGLSATEREKQVRLREAGSAATAEQRAQIESLVDQIAAETEALERNRQQAEARAQAWEWGFDTVNGALEQMITNGESAEDAVRRLAIALASAVAQAALLNTGPLAGLGLNLFGGAPAVADPWAGLRFAKGAAFDRGRVVSTPTAFPMAGGTGLMGEAGPEAVMPLTRMPDGSLGVEAVAAAGGRGAGQPVHVHYAPTFHFAGTQAEFEEFRRQADIEFERVRVEVPGLVLQAMKDGDLS